MSNPRRILVTGGCGYVGSVLVPYLAHKYPVRVYDSFAFGNPLPTDLGIECIEGDIRNQAGLALALKGVTHVIHLAGIVTDELVDINPLLSQEINVDASRNLCILASKAGEAERFIYASSSSVYGSSPIDCTEESMCYPETAYARQKFEAERLLLREFRERLEVVALRSATCCGPSPRMRLDTIINVFSKQAMYDEQITVHGGDQVRSNVHVQDIARAYEALLLAPASVVDGHVFNATCTNATALDLAVLVQEAYLDIYGIIRPVVIDSTKRDTRHYRMNASKIRDAVGWAPVYSIRQAVEANWAYFLQGGIDPNAALHYNTRRMRQSMLTGMAPTALTTTN